MITVHSNAVLRQGKDVIVLQYLQSTLLGRIYRRYLRRYPIVRTFALWTWKNLFPLGVQIYSKISFIKLNRALLIKLSEYSSEQKVIYPSQSAITPHPGAFPKTKSYLAHQWSTEFEFPPIFLTTIENCTVTGASNLASVEDGIICHDLFDFGHDYTSEELHGRFVINAKKSTLTRLSYNTPDNVIQNGAVFTDAVSINYAHFLTEVLPRVYLFSKENLKTDIPIIIDAGLHQNIMEALELVVGREIELIGLDKGEPMLVRSLHVVSPCGYVPFERRPGTEKLPGHSHGIFSPSALFAMREYIKTKVAELAPEPKRAKLFIRRNSGYRNVTNANEIEEMLVAKGFFVVEPEKLSFLEQVELFSRAEVVVGATGAAFANLIFCNPSAKIIIMIAIYAYMPYGYWQNMACAVGNRVVYVLGKGGDATLHSNFQINPTDVLNAIA